ncbi:MAG: hypothetical protein IJN44_02285 [Clostridia bacterium]|nr:hypothetical protein [Clostridia bacterium]
MTEKENKQLIQHLFEASLSGIADDPRMAQRVLRKAHETQEKGGFIVKKKLSVGLVFLLVFLILSATVAFAAMMGWGHIEQSMDFAVEYGYYDQWTLDAKMRLIASMEADGLEIDEKEWQSLQGNQLNEQEKHALADEILTGYYGDKEYLYYYTMATVEWGEPQTWNLEQRHWFYKTQREKGLLGDDFWIDLLPEEGDMTQEQAENIAKQAVAEVFGLSEETLAHLHGDVAFFVTEDYPIPRWMVNLYMDENVWSTKYSVLLTREGEVTEDPESLGVWTPEHEKLRREKQNTPQANTVNEWENTARMRLEAQDAVYYNPAGGKNYHFLQDCPRVSANDLPLAKLEIDSEVFHLYTPCCACVQNNDLWPMQDRIKFGIGQWKTPGADWMEEEKALSIAYKAMNDRQTDVTDLYPVIAWSPAEADGAEYYVSFFEILWRDEGEVFLNPKFVVGIDAVSGQVIYISEGNG